jgi:uncharacterized membrane protein YgcG
MAAGPNWAVLVMLLAAMLLLGGILLMWLGYRGRRVDDHPICRKCGYDLFGRPEGSERCSECGSQLAEPNAIRIGRRKPVRGLMVVGMLMLLAGGGGVGLLGNAMRQGFDLNQYKPVWWLLGDTRSASPAVRDAALAELLGRVKSATMSDANTRKLVDRALEVQGDLKQPWTPGWGDIVEWVHASGKLPAEKWRRYAKQAVALTLTARPKVRRGAPLPVRVAQQARLGSNGRLWMEYGLKRTELNGRECDKSRSGGGGASLSSGGGGSSSWCITENDETFKKLSPGAHTVRIVMDLSIYDVQPPSWQPGSKATPVAKTRADMQANFELVDEETVKIIKDPTLRTGVESAVTVKVKQDPGGYLNAEVDVRSPPVSLAYDVIARDGQKEYKIGGVAFLAGKGGGCYTGSSVKDFKASKCDVILRPSKATAENQVDVTEMWDGEVVVKDVAVEQRK